MIDISALSDEEEAAVLEDGLKSRFWELFTLRYQHQVFTIMGAALGEKTQHRDWLAGKATGMKEALRYPENRVRALKTKIEAKKKENK